MVSLSKNKGAKHSAKHNLQNTVELYNNFLFVAKNFYVSWF